MKEKILNLVKEKSMVSKEYETKMDSINTEINETINTYVKENNLINKFVSYDNTPNTFYKISEIEYNNFNNIHISSNGYIVLNESSIKIENLNTGSNSINVKAFFELKFYSKDELFDKIKIKIERNI